MHTGKDLAICKEVQRPARIWAKQQGGRFKVKEVNGQEEIELLEDGSRWLVRAKSAVNGFTVGCAVVDEAWDVKAAPIDEDLWPTMTERAQHQMLLVSTAHRLATVLMLRRRQIALAELEDAGENLILEWSAPAGCDLKDREGWRQASPYWTPRRERLVESQLEALAAGEIMDPDEPNPEESFKAQWLNQWPRKLTENVKNEPLLPGGLWFGLEDDDLAEAGGQVFVAVEDDYGKGAGVAVVCRLDDGRMEVDGYGLPDWDEAIDWVRRLSLTREIRELHIGASMIDRVPVDLPVPLAAVNAQASAGLAVFRDLAASRMLVHSDSGELDLALAETMVSESPSGLQIKVGPRHLVKAVAWAILAAHKPARVYAVR
jgi:hypothetical protein